MSSNLEKLEVQRQEDRQQMRRFLWGVGIGVCLGSITAIFMPLMVTSFSFISLGALDPNEIGDTIGGIMGPTVGLIGAILTFLAFYSQIKANTDQRHQFRQSLVQQQDALNQQTQQFKATIEQQETALEKQTEQFQITIAQQITAAKIQKEQSDEQIRIAREQTEHSKKEFVHQDIATKEERFANRFYTMMSIHRENVAALDVGRPGKRHTGRRAILPLFNELKFIYWSTVNFHDNEWLQTRQNIEIQRRDIFQISYLTFFFGFGDVSTPMVLDLVGAKFEEFAKLLHHYLQKLKLYGRFTVPTPNGTFVYDNEYDLGTGHLRRLSHYFRHLYQTVKYVDDQDSIVLDYGKKYEYISNLRAQLSVHEQLLLYYNARSVLGKPWLDIKDNQEGLLSRYCMIKSIPLNAADFFETPEKFFSAFNKENKPMFEWTEIKRRINELH